MELWEVKFYFLVSFGDYVVFLVDGFFFWVKFVVIGSNQKSIFVFLGFKLFGTQARTVTFVRMSYVDGYVYLDGIQWGCSYFMNRFFSRIYVNSFGFDLKIFFR